MTGFFTDALQKKNRHRRKPRSVENTPVQQRQPEVKRREKAGGGFKISHSGADQAIECTRGHDVLGRSTCWFNGFLVVLLRVYLVRFQLRVTQNHEKPRKSIYHTIQKKNTKDHKQKL